MAHIERSIDIDRPAGEVFHVLVDLDRLPRWATILVENHDTPGRPLQTGDRFRQTIRIAGIHLQTDWRVHEVDRPTRVSYEATEERGGKLRMTQRVHESPDGGCRVELDLDYDLPGGVFGEAADRLFVERRNQREAEHTLENLKDLLERPS